MEITNIRFMWKSEDVKLNYADTNLNASLSIGKSRSDEESIKLAVEAAVTAAAKSMLPIP